MPVRRAMRVGVCVRAACARGRCLHQVAVAGGHGHQTGWVVFSFGLRAPECCCQVKSAVGGQQAPVDLVDLRMEAHKQRGVCGGGGGGASHDGDGVAAAAAVAFCCCLVHAVDLKWLG
eukprot:363453-Chlamydomonas_euryale.AAC.1